MRWDVIDLSYFPSLEKVTYHYTVGGFNSRQYKRLTFPLYSVIDNPTKLFRGIKIKFMAACGVLNDKIMFETLKM